MIHYFIIFVKCRRRDSNPHRFPYRVLNPARLPIPPLRQQIKINISRPSLKFLNVFEISDYNYNEEPIITFLLLHYR